MDEQAAAIEYIESLRIQPDILSGIPDDVRVQMGLNTSSFSISTVSEVATVKHHKKGKKGSKTPLMQEAIREESVQTVSEPMPIIAHEENAAADVLLAWPIVGALIAQLLM